MEPAYHWGYAAIAAATAIAIGPRNINDRAYFTTVPFSDPRDTPLPFWKNETFIS
jgi:hypothetical protein